MNLLIWMSNLLPVLFITIGWIALVVCLRRNNEMIGGYQETMKKQNELIEQQMAVLGETNDLLKKLNESRR